MARILLLEPDPVSGKRYQELLIKHGHKVSLCRNAQEGILETDKSAPDMVIMELQLSGHSGIEFLYEFRSYPEWLKIPVLIYTSLHPSFCPLPSEKLQQLGVVGYLYKAQDSLDKLMKQVKRSLNLKQHESI